MRARTRRFLEMAARTMPDDQAARRAATTWIGDGWDEKWAFPDMPRWLRPGRWHPSFDAAVAAVGTGMVEAGRSSVGRVGRARGALTPGLNRATLTGVSTP